MTKIIDCENDKKRLIDSNNEPISQISFARIEHLHSESNYYLLWKDNDSTGFYLYNSVKKRFALTGKNTNSLKNSPEFLKTDLYSDVSKSFVAYRKDNGCTYLFFEDADKGKIGERGESFIGKEYHGKRAVQNTKGEWVFFDCERRCIVPRFNFRDHRTGISHTQPLDRWLCGNHFITKFENHVAITQYRNQGPFKNISGYFNEEIEECPNDYIIASELSNSIGKYVLIKDGEIIGHFVNKPIYDNEHSWFKGKKDGQWYFVKKDYEVTHYKWEEDNFKFFGRFILNNSHNKGWLIYDSETGHNICQDWHNIRIDETDNALILLVDTDSLTDKQVSIDDVEKHINELHQSYSKILKQNEYNSDLDRIFSVQPIEICDERIDDVQMHDKEDLIDEQENSNLQGETFPTAQPKTEYRSYYDFDCENIIPQHIQHIVFSTSFRRYSKSQNINEGSYSFCSTLAMKNVSKGDYVCWVFVDDKAVVITQRITEKSNRHKCIFRKVFDSANFIEKGKIYNRGTYQIDIENVSENNIINEIEKCFEKFYNDKNKNKQTSEKEKKEVVVKPEKQVQNNTTNASCVNKYSFLDGYDITTILKSNQVIREICLKGNILSRGTKLRIRDIFAKKHYRILDNTMIVLIDDRNLVRTDYHEHLTRHYNIIGEGMDFQYSQDFDNKNNTAIRDNTYPIFLFKPIDNEHCQLIDHVVCCNYTISNQYRKVDNFSKSRKVINFELVSLWLLNKWKIQ